MAGKKDIRERAKSLWLKGMKAIGNTAANIANNTRFKVDEVTLQNRRREVLNDLANKTYERGSFSRTDEPDAGRVKTAG